MNKKEIKEWIYTILLALVLVFLIRTFALDTRIVPTTSMVPAIVPGDRLFVEKITHRFVGLERGDIVVFEPPTESGLKDDLIKRLIGLPGDSIEVKDGKLFLNGIAQVEDYLNEDMEYLMEEQLVPEGKIFVMGDNRNRSFDSHSWGFADIESVEGKALLTYWPFDRIRYWGGEQN